MGLRRLGGRITRTLRGPLLSVVIPCKDAEEFLETAIRSVLNQSLRNLEVIVVDDKSTDTSRAIASRLSSRDRRVRVIDGRGEGPGAARNDGVKLARGRYLTFVDADDRVLPGAYEEMVSALASSGSDYAMGGYQRHDAISSHRPNVVSRVHSRDRLGTSAEEFPELLEEPVLWNKVFRRAFWHRAVGHIPEDVNYEDQEPCLDAALTARSIDVLARDVYSWRLPSDRTSRSQTKQHLHDLHDRATVIHRMRGVLPRAPESVAAHLPTVWLGRDLVMYADHAFTGTPGYADTLRGLAREVAELLAPEAWRTIPFWDRLTAWVLAYGSSDDLAEVIASRAEDTTSTPIALNSDPTIVAPVLERLGDLPDFLREVGERDLHLSVRMPQPGLVEGSEYAVEGSAFVNGLAEHDQPLLEVEFLSPTGTAVPASLVERFHSPDVDYYANDPWRTYAEMGLRAVASSEDGPPHSIRVSCTVGARRLSSSVPIPAGARPSSESAVLVDRVSVEKETLRVEGRHPAGTTAPQVWLASSKYQVTGAMAVTETGWAAEFKLDDPAMPSDGYFLRWGSLGSGVHEGWCHAGNLEEANSFHGGSVRRAEVSVSSAGNVSCTVGPPLSRVERTRRGRQLLIDSPLPPVTPGIFFESFNGKGAGGNPAAVLAELRDHGVRVPMWWSTVDGTIPVPNGAERVILGSAEWFDVARSARVVVTDNNFPYWYATQPAQYLIQTWHGTPIKRLLLDAPEAFIPVTYRRLMANQVAKWDLLLAQTAGSARNLISSTGYTGEVRIGEYPRNSRLLQGEEGAARVRAHFGLSAEERTILYAPTWRERLRSGKSSQAIAEFIDPTALAEKLNATVLVRSHHMNNVRAEGCLEDAFGSACGCIW